MSIPDDSRVVAYCGLCCLDCHGYTGKIADLARDLRKELRAHKYDKFAHVIAEEGFGKVFQDYDKCYQVLGAMVRFRCKGGCRSGGGPPFCKIRKCCVSKGFAGCWECSEFQDCEKLEFLAPVHGDAHLKDLLAIKKKGIQSFLGGKRFW